MDKKQKMVPKLRFPGFTDDWEQRKLGEFANIVTGKLDANAMKEDGEYDFYTSGIQKYKIDVPAFEGPAITIAGNGATVGYMHLADGKFNAYQRTYVLSAFQANREYLFFEIGNKLPKKIAQEARTGNIPYIVMDMLTDLMISVPSEQEQKKVGEFMMNLDNLITLHQRKLDQMKNYKQGLLQKMFPKNGEHIPEIRFPGFTDAWEQRKLADCLSEITYGFTNPMSDTEDGPWKLTAKDIVNGKIDYSSARHTSQIEYESLTDKSKPLIGDLLLTKDGTLGRTAIVDTENICINQSVALLRFNEKCSAQYAKTLLDTPMYQKQMLDDAGGGTIKHIYITKVDKMFIPVPSMREQEQLVCYFDNLDNLITLHQRKLDQVKEYKKGLLQQMFV